MVKKGKAQTVFSGLRFVLLISVQLRQVKLSRGE